MSDENPLINLGDLTKPATVLIEKVSDAIGVLYLPTQIKRVAKAQAEAAKTQAFAGIEIDEMKQRGLTRLIHEEGKKQKNIENITAQAINELKDDAKPESIDDDWIGNLFEKCRNVSNKEMQSLWAKLLAGEANKPGSFSKRTVDFVSTLDRNEANLFTTLCGFGWNLGEILLLIYDTKDPIYEGGGITFDLLQNLDNIGLITYKHEGNFLKTEIPREVDIFYYGTQVRVEFPRDEDNNLSIGQVLLTNVGQELALISGSKKVDGFLEYVLKVWHEEVTLLLCHNLPNPKKTTHSLENDEVMDSHFPSLPRRNGIRGLRIGT